MNDISMFALTVILSQIVYIASTLCQHTFIGTLATVIVVQFVSLVHLRLFWRIQCLDNQPAFFSCGNLLKLSSVLLFFIGELLSVTTIWAPVEPKAYLASAIAPAVPVLFSLFVMCSFAIYGYIAGFINSKDITVLDVIFGIKHNSNQRIIKSFSFGEARESSLKLNKTSFEADQILRAIAQCKVNPEIPGCAEEKRQKCNDAATKRVNQAGGQATQ